jgi:hypothetical protein
MKVIRLILFQGQVLHILIANSAMKFTQSVAIAANARSGVTLLLYKTIGHHDVKIESRSSHSRSGSKPRTRQVEVFPLFQALAYRLLLCCQTLHQYGFDK